MPRDYATRQGFVVRLAVSTRHSNAAPEKLAVQRGSILYSVLVVLAK